MNKEHVSNIANIDYIADCGNCDCPDPGTGADSCTCEDA